MCTIYYGFAVAETLDIIHYHVVPSTCMGIARCYIGLVILCSPIQSTEPSHCEKEKR